MQLARMLQPKKEKHNTRNKTSQMSKNKFHLQYERADDDYAVRGTRRKYRTAKCVLGEIMQMMALRIYLGL